jgi:P-type Ca2+ transporter type 2C
MEQQSGLSDSDVKLKLEQFGLNKLPTKPSTLRIKILIRQLASPLIYILLFSAVLTFVLGQYIDAIIITIAILINTLLGYYQEQKAEKALESLKNFLHETTTVIRQGKRKEILSEQIVPGDIVLLAQGEKIPADGKVLESYGLMVNESILTGESFAVKKDNGTDVYMGTTVLIGKGVFQVASTGQETKIGEIAKELKEQKEDLTPLQNKLARLANSLAVIVVVISLLIFAIGVFSGKDTLEMFTVAVAVAVAAIPEGLMVALTVILAIGMQRIFKRKALVRKLISAETLGSVTLVASDKTGTLTEGVMTVSKTDFLDNNAIKVMHYANISEDPLELAMSGFVNKWILDNKDIITLNAKKVDELPFDSERKYQSVIVVEDLDYSLYVSGAPEVVVELCTLNPKDKELLLNKIHDWGSRGIRLVGLAEKQGVGSKIINKDINGLTWLGLVGVEDPIRDSIVQTVEQMTKAGIKFVIITGDYLPTAVAVWNTIKKQSELLNTKYKNENYVTGEVTKKWSDQEWTENLSITTIFARVSPTQKLKIVEKFKEQGEVVAIFGDGVNDTLALKKGDIGIVVNEASDTAKEVADIVLLDSNFNTVVAAIEEGRAIHDNIKKVTLYLLSDSFSEIILIIMSLIIGTPLPLTAVQILWINLITDGFPNLALTIEPKEKGVMLRKPVDPKASLFNGEMKVLTATISIVTGVVAFLRFYYIYQSTGDLVLARTVTFVALGLDSLIYVYSVRSLRKSIFSTPFFSNPLLFVAVLVGAILQLTSIYVPFFNNFLHTVPLSLSHWLFILSVSILVVIIIELIKWIYRKKYD